MDVLGDNELRSCILVARDATLTHRLSVFGEFGVVLEPSLTWRAREVMMLVVPRGRVASASKGVRFMRGGLFGLFLLVGGSSLILLRHRRVDLTRTTNCGGMSAGKRFVGRAVALVSGDVFLGD